MTKKVWNLMYALGATGRVMGDSNNPQLRRSALDGAATVSKNGWRVWVEHHATKERIFESAAEKAHRESAECARIVRFAEENVPNFRTPK